MISRRKFIQSNMLGLALPLAGASTYAAEARPGSKPPAPGSSDNGERDYWNDWPSDLTAQMNAARSRRLAQLQALRNAADVRARIDVAKLDRWDPDPRNECSHGIHFFLTREEAENF